MLNKSFGSVALGLVTQERVNKGGRHFMLFTQSV